jgi:MFS transporter, ceroid-lipofuscinosis neuronal protein 7
MTEVQQNQNAEAAVENGKKESQLKLLETPEERNERLWSLRIIYFTMFLISLAFSIILSGVWPYLDRVSAFTYLVI